jgi:hypothetical protein
VTPVVSAAGDPHAATPTTVLRFLRVQAAEGRQQGACGTAKIMAPRPDGGQPCAAHHGAGQ